MHYGCRMMLLVVNKLFSAFMQMRYERMEKIVMQ